MIIFFLVHVCCCMYSFICDYCITVSAYIELLVVFILDALKSVFFWASLAHFEETRAPVWGKRQLLQHDVLRRIDFLPKSHLCIWTQRDKQKTKELVYTINTCKLIWLLTRQIHFSISYTPTYQTSLNTNYIHTEKSLLQKALYMDCWLGTPADMMNEQLSPLVIHSCLVLVLWLAPHASYCMLIMEMS